MKSLFQEEGAAEILARLEALHADAPRQWGKMDVAQMLAHCCVTMEVASGKKRIPYGLLGKIIGRFFRASFSDDRPMSKNSPTDGKFVMRGAFDIAAEKARLRILVREFVAAGEPGCTNRPHSFFGPMTASEWGKGMYKHLDHHFRQFGA